MVALWAWQCVVGAVLLCFALSMLLSAAAAWFAVRGPLFAAAPHGVVHAYGLGGPQEGGPWAAVTALALAGGALWTGAMLAREVIRARARTRAQGAELRFRAPLLPGEEPDGARLVVLEGPRPDAWWQPGARPQLVVTTAALDRLKGSQLDAVLAHEQGHVAARHDWLLHCSRALAGGFPQVPVFAAFEAEMYRLVELAADDVASRRFGRADDRAGAGRAERGPGRLRDLPRSAGARVAAGASAAVGRAPAVGGSAAAADGAGHAGPGGTADGGVRARPERAGVGPHGPGAARIPGCGAIACGGPGSAAPCSRRP